MSIDSMDPRPALILVAADKHAADLIYERVKDLLEGEDGLVTLSAGSVDRPFLERALSACQTRSPKRRRLRLLR
jgi:hypothetical protein